MSGYQKSDAFDFPVSVSSGFQVTPETYSAKYADGFSQRAPKGRRSGPRRWSIRMSKKGNAIVLAAEIFLRERRGAYAFTFLDPDSGEPVLVVCPTWSKTWSGTTHSSLAATFEEVPA